jgi:phosphoserine phosphatase
MKKLALFDIDGVIHGGHLIFDIVQDSEKKGIIPFGVWKKILFEIEEYKSGRKNYKEAADSMLEAYAKSLYGLSYRDVFDHSYKYISNSKKKMFEYFLKILTELIKKYDIYFVTTNFQFIAEAYAKYVGIKNYISSIAEVKKGKFTGKVELSLGGNKGIVSELIKKYGKNGSVAFGDSENDADMLKEVEHPFVFEPNEKLEKICVGNGWRMVDRDSAYKVLTNLL